MFKRFAILAAAIFVLAGCERVVPVKNTDVGVYINGVSNEWDNQIYSGQTIKLGTLCKWNCSDAHIFEGHHTIATIVSDYAMPKSNDMDLTLGLSIKVTLNRTGDVLERLKKSSTKYRYTVEGSATDNQIFRTDIGTIVKIDLSEAQVKGLVRPILEQYELSQAYYNISKNGSILTDLRQSVTDHLVAIDSPLTLLSVEVSKIAQPESILKKKREVENLDSQEKLHKRQLDMRESRMVREQLIRLREAKNELELLEINSQFMTPRVLAYKWIQVANSFSENGIPMAVTPEMLLPALNKLSDETFDVSIAKKKLEARIKSVEGELKKQQADSEQGE